MAQRYTTFIPGYVFNILNLYIRAHRHIHIYIYTTIAMSSSEPILRKNFSEQSAQYRIEPKALWSVFYELIRHISISLLQVIRCVQQKFSTQLLDKSLNNIGVARLKCVKGA